MHNKTSITHINSPALLGISARVQVCGGTGGVQSDIFRSDDLCENVMVWVCVKGGDGAGGAEPGV